MHRKELLADSGGAGRWRAASACRPSRATAATATGASRRSSTGSSSRARASPAASPARSASTCSSTGEHPPAKTLVPLALDDHVHLRLAGGAGYGEPLSRPAEEVLRDVVLGFVTIEAAEREYARRDPLHGRRRIASSGCRSTTRSTPRRPPGCALPEDLDAARAGHVGDRGHAEEEAVLDDAGDRADRRRQHRGIGDRAEPAVEDVVALVGREAGARLGRAAERGQRAARRPPRRTGSPRPAPAPSRRGARRVSRRRRRPRTGRPPRPRSSRAAAPRRGP